MEEQKPECSHQYTDQGDPHSTPFNYCPWCGIPFGKNFDKEDPVLDNEDDCQKGGCQGGDRPRSPNTESDNHPVAQEQSSILDQSVDRDRLNSFADPFP